MHARRPKNLSIVTAAAAIIIIIIIIVKRPVEILWQLLAPRVAHYEVSPSWPPFRLAEYINAYWR